MPSLRSLFVTFTAVVACVTGAAAHAPQTTPYNTLVPRGTVYDPRCDCFVKPLPVVIDQATEQIKPLVDQLKSLTAEECTVDKIRPIADEIKGVIVEGVSQLTLLAKGNVEVELVLSTGNGTLSVSEVASVLAGLVNLVLGGFAVVLKLIVSSKSSEVITIFADVCITLSHFLSISVSLVGGLLEVVTPLIKDSLQVVVQLGIVSVFKFTGLDFTKTCEIGVGVAAGEVAGSFIDVLKTAFQAIQPLADKLRNLSESDATSFTIQPIVAEIRTILITCISQIGALVGQEKEVVLLREGQVLAVADAAGCVGELVLVLFDGICEAIKKVSITESKVVIGLFVDVGLLVAQLIKVSAEVVTFDGGIIAILKPIIKEAFGLAITLGITECYDFLEIDWTHYGGSLGVSVGASFAVTSTIIGTATTIVGGGFTTPVANPTVGVTTVTGPATTFVSTIALPTPTQPVGGNGNSDNGSDDDLEDCDEEEQDGGNTTPGNGTGNGNDDDLEDCDEEQDGGNTTPGNGTGNGNDDSEEDSDDEDQHSTPGNGSSTPGSGNTKPGNGENSNNGGSNNNGGNNGGSNNGGSSGNNDDSEDYDDEDTPANGGNTGGSTGGNTGSGNNGNNGGNTGSGSGNGNNSGSSGNGNGNGNNSGTGNGSSGSGNGDNSGSAGSGNGNGNNSGTGNGNSGNGSGDNSGNGNGNTTPPSSSVPASPTSSVPASPTSSVPASLTSSVPASPTNSGAAVPSCTAGPNGQVSVSLVAVVQQCQSKVTLLVEKLKKFSSQECNEDNVKPVVTEIKEIFTVAIEQIKVFVGASATVVLASDCSGATLSVSAFASLFATLINLIFGAITVVLKTASSENQKVLISIFAELCITISVFIKTCCDIVVFEGGLTAILTPLIQTSIGICITLGIKSSFEFLQIDWTKVVIEIGAGLGASVSIVTIVNNATTIITPLIEKLGSLKGDDCNAANITPVVAEIKTVFTVCIEQLQILVGAGAEVVFANGDSVISIGECGKLVGGLINLVLGACGGVLKIVVSADYKVVLGLFVELGITIGTFIKTSCDIVVFDGGLKTILGPIIQGSLGICVTLGIKEHFEFLQIDWTKVVVELGASVSIVTIVNNATTILTPLIEKLGSLKGDDCNAANITPIVAEIKTVFTGCIEQLQVLVGAGAEVVFANGGSVISIGDCGKLVGDLINLVFGACGSILKIVVSADYKVVLGLFVDLGITVGAFIKTSCDVVVFEGGLKTILGPIIKGSLGICVTLGIKEHFEFLGIDWTSIGAGVGVGATVSIVSIIGNCTQSITPLVQKLKDLKAEDCTAATIGPIVGEIKGIFNITIEQIKVLAGASIEVILANGSGAVVSIGECAQIVGDLVNLVFVTVTTVLKIVVEAESKAVIAIFGELVIIVGSFIQTCHSVVTVDGGLIQVVVPIIKSSLGACIQLDVTSHFEFLQIDFTQLAIDLGINIGVGVGVGASGSIVSIITELTAQIKPLIDQLSGLKAGDCGADRVGEIIGQIKVVIVASTEKIKALGNVQVSIDEVSGLLTALLQLIFGGLTAVLKIVTVGHAKAVFGLCAELGVTVGALLQTCTGAVGGLETAITGQIHSTLSQTFTTIVKLDISSSFGFLGVDLNSFGVKSGGVLSSLLQGAGF